jgi:outer membrane protein OmpA-like peptidoglycan-associated protein
LKIDRGLRIEMRRVRTKAATGLVCLAVLMLGPTAFAAAQASNSLPELQVQRFRPAPGPADYLQTYSTVVAPHLEVDVGLYIDWASEPLQVATFSQEYNPVLRSQTTASLLANIGLLDFWEVGLLFPVTVSQSGGDLTSVLPEGAPAQTLDSFGLNSPRLSSKVSFLDILTDPLGLALVAAGTIPVGTENTFTMDGGFSGDLIVAGEFWAVEGIRVAANAGYRYRHESTIVRDAIISDEVLWGVAANIPFLVSTVDVLVDIHGAIGIAEKPAGRSGISAAEVPVEVDVASRWRIHDHWTLLAGVGGGLNKGVGTPDIRVFGGLSGHWVSGGQWGYDYDRDGIYGLQDKCPNEPEDFDGYQDLDGCPDPDNDKDGIPDDLDRCDNTPEDVPVGPDGCPDNDLDGDGIPNDRDQCPEDPEDIDRFQDRDGCPDLDNDQDGIPDKADNCPNKAENFNDFLDEDGCPDDPNAKVHIDKDRIIITEQVHFETAKDIIRTESYEILDNVAIVLNENAQIVKIRIEGHTDDRGSDTYNLDLSQRRAESVRAYLIEKGGVSERRLDAVGFGETRPIKSNDDSAGRAMNRRVEFTILEMREY